VTRRLTIGVAFAAAVTLAGCGADDPAGVDRRDPESVARAYYLTYYDCGEQGAGLRYDLSTSPYRDWSRATYLKLERNAGCRPGHAPAIDARLDARQRDRAVITIRGNHISTTLTLVRLDTGEWKVDTSESATPTRAS
jgi:hypothetical protein